MRFSTNRNRYVYINKAMRWAKMKKIANKLTKMQFKEVRSDEKGATDVQV